MHHCIVATCSTGRQNTDTGRDWTGVKEGVYFLKWGWNGRMGLEKVLEVLFPGPVGCVGRTREVHGSGCGAGEISMAFLWVPMRSSLGVSQEVGIAVIGICNKKQKRDQCGLGDRNCSPPLRLQWSFKLSHLLQEGEELHSLSAISHAVFLHPALCPCAFPQSTKVVVSCHCSFSTQAAVVWGVHSGLCMWCGGLPSQQLSKRSNLKMTPFETHHFSKRQFIFGLSLP